MFLEFGGDGFVAGVDGDGAFPSGNSFGASAKFQLDLGEVVVDDGIFDFVFGIALGVFFKKLNGASATNLFGNLVMYLVRLNYLIANSKIGME